MWLKQEQKQLQARMTSDKLIFQTYVTEKNVIMAAQYDYEVNLKPPASYLGLINELQSLGEFCFYLTTKQALSLSFGLLK